MEIFFCQKHPITKMNQFNFNKKNNNDFLGNDAADRPMCSYQMSFVLDNSNGKFYDNFFQRLHYNNYYYKYDQKFLALIILNKNIFK